MSFFFSLSDNVPPNGVQTSIITRHDRNCTTQQTKEKSLTVCKKKISYFGRYLAIETSLRGQIVDAARRFTISSCLKIKYYKCNIYNEFTRDFSRV